MKSKRMLLHCCIGAAGMVILILDAPLALKAGSEGIDLCIRSVIPALFPLMVLSIYTTGNLPRGNFSLLKPISRLCRIPHGTEGILITGLLGGYPTGAQAVTQAWKGGFISDADARRMLAFCNNAGPAFLFGMLSPAFRIPSLWALWGIHILSALLTATVIPGGNTLPVRWESKSGITLSCSVSRGIRVMATVCGWILLFRIVMEFLEIWVFWCLPDTARILLRGILELTNGCTSLNTIENEAVRFLLASAMLSFGGICVGMQTLSVTEQLGTGLYVPGKLLQCGFSLLLGSLLIPMIYPGNTSSCVSVLSAIWIALWFIFLRIRENKGSNFVTLGV